MMLLKMLCAAWAKSRSGSNIDDMSLLITDGPAASHTPNSAQWVSALDAEQVDPRTSSPNLDILFRAAGLVSDPLPRPGMSRADPVHYRAAGGPIRRIPGKPDRPG